MKKRLEAELISIAHRVLKLKNKSEVDQLFVETQKLYEALSVLKFYGDHIEQVKDTISESELEEKLADSLENKSTKKDKTDEPIEAVKETPVPVVPTDEDPSFKSEQAEQSEPAEEAQVVVGEINVEDDEDIEEEMMADVSKKDHEEDEKEAAGFDPIFEMASEAPTEEPKEEAAAPIAEAETEEEPKTKTQQISFEHLLGEDYKEPEFVKPNDVTPPAPVKAQQEEETPAEIVVDKVEKPVSKASNLNEKLGTGINIGLNDRIGFVKYLFDNSTEDYNRVLSQLNTFSTYADAKEFIDEMVKPDYNNWKGQEDFAERFLEIVEKKFS